MSELRRRLQNEAHRISGSDDAYDQVVQRGGRRRTTRRVAGAFLALAVAGAGLGLAFAAFDPDVEPRPGRPTPGPTRTSELSPARPVVVEVRDASGHPLAGRFAALLIDSDLAEQPGDGYRTLPVLSHEDGVLPRTSIQWKTTLGTSWGPDARRLESRFFPGARLRRSPGDVRTPTSVPVIFIQVGADFAEREAVHIDALLLTEEFMALRQQGNQHAEIYMSFFAIRDFNRGVGGLSLDGYVKGAPWRYTVTSVTRQSPTTTVFRLRHELRDGTPIAHETVTVVSPPDAEPYIESVERNA